MTLISNPILFSDKFAVTQEELQKAGFLDPFLMVDTPLFIDPTLLSKSRFPIIREKGVASFKAQFEKVVGLLEISEKIGDVAWRNAAKFLDFSEPAYTGLGYSHTRRAGASRPAEVTRSVLSTSKEIIRLGSKNPEMISLMGFFEENVGADTISDFSTNAIFHQLCSLTQQFCESKSLDLKEFVFDGLKYNLPNFKEGDDEIGPIILVPTDILRTLPVAEDWSQVQMAIDENSVIRDRVNQLLGGIAKPTVSDRKEATRKAALQTSQIFESFLTSVSDASTPYDPAQDLFNYFKFRELMRDTNLAAKLDQGYDLENDEAELMRLVFDCLETFRSHVEIGNLWEHLWDGDNPKLERAAQLLFFAIADVHCQVNGADISPEANMGGGPVDFKFSKGYHNRVLVEMKKSTGTVVHGYEKQLERYKKASKTFAAIFVIIDYGQIGNKLKEIYSLRDAQLAKGERASEIYVVDATKKKSASKM